MASPRAFDLELSPTIIEPAVRAALNEDLGLGVKLVADPANPNLADGLDSGNGPQRDL